MAKLLLMVILALATGVIQAEDSSRLPAEQMPLATMALVLDVAPFRDGAIAVGERGHILLSDDQRSWRQADVVPTRSALTAVTSYGDQLWAVGHDAVILHSTDNGVTWQHQIAPENSFFPDFRQPLLDVLFISASDGFALGAYGYLLRTRNGGQTWQEERLNEDDDFHLNAIIQLSDGTLFIASEAGNYYRSTDQGASWERGEMPYSGSMFGVLTTGPERLLTYGLRGHVFESVDKGVSWTEVDTGVLNSLMGGTVAADGTVILAGANGQILVRKGRAGRFESMTHAAGDDMTAVVVAADDALMIGSERGVIRYTLGDSVQ